MYEKIPQLIGKTETVSHIGKIENVVGMSMEASGGRSSRLRRRSSREAAGETARASAIRCRWDSRWWSPTKVEACLTSYPRSSRNASSWAAAVSLAAALGPNSTVSFGI